MHRCSRVSTGSRVSTSHVRGQLDRLGAIEQRCHVPGQLAPGRAQRDEIPVQVEVVPSSVSRNLRHAVVEEALPVGRALGEPGVEQGLQRRPAKSLPPHEDVDVGELAPARIAVPRGAEHGTLHDEERVTEGAP